MTNVLADYPAFTVIALPEGHDLTLDNDKGYARTCSIALRIKAFPRDKYEYLRSFTIGFDETDGYWTYGNGSMISSERSAKEYCLGASLGDTIRVEGQDFIIKAAPNNNIKLVRA